MLFAAWKQHQQNHDGNETNLFHEKKLTVISGANIILKLIKVHGMCVKSVPILIRCIPKMLPAGLQPGFDRNRLKCMLTKKSWLRLCMTVQHAFIISHHIVDHQTDRPKLIADRQPVTQLPPLTFGATQKLQPFSFL